MERFQEELPEQYADGSVVLIGESSSGSLVTASLDKLPHLSVLGGSSSGKSQAFHAMLYPMLARNTPQTLRIALADPKAELARYRNLGFLWKPLCSNSEEVEKMLTEAFAEGEERIKVYKNSVPDRVFNNLESYNEYCAEQ